MGMQDYVEEVVGTLLDFGFATGSKVLDRAKTVVLRITGDPDPNGGDEELDDCELWGPAPLLYRPQSATDAGDTEVIFWRRGDERVVLATKDRRFQVEVGVGEVRLVALGKDGSRQAQVVLKPDGDVSLEGVGIVVLGDSIKLGSPTAGDYVALASKVEAELGKIAAALASAQAPSGGGPVTYGPAAYTPPITSVGAQKVKAE